MGNTKEKLAQLKKLLKGCHRLIIYSHNNPDPDAIASALALKYLAQEHFGVYSHLVLGGIVGRAENEAMIKHLRVHLIPAQLVHIGPKSCTALVDTQPRFGNHSFPMRLHPDIIIDHHPLRRSTKAPFVDVRPEYGTTSTILTEYIFASGLKLTPRIATALSYAISSETEDLGREASPLDVAAYVRIFPSVALKTLSRIINPPLSRDYYYTLERALHNAFVYRHMIGTRLGDIPTPDVVSQIADMLLRHERISWAICLGHCQGKMIISIRTRNQKARAGALLRRILGREGSAGGHEMIAGGQVDCRDMSAEKYAEMEETVISRFLRAIGYKEGTQPRKFLEGETADQVSPDLEKYLRKTNK